MRAISTAFQTMRRGLRMGSWIGLVALLLFSASCGLDVSDTTEAPETNPATNENIDRAAETDGDHPSVTAKRADEAILEEGYGMLVELTDWLEKGNAESDGGETTNYDVDFLAVDELPEQTALYFEAYLHTDGQPAEVIAHFSYDIEDLGNETIPALVGIAAAPDGSSQWRWGAYSGQQINPESERFVTPKTLEVTFGDQMDVDLGATPRILMPEEGVPIDSSFNTVAVILYDDEDAPSSLEDFLQTREDLSRSSWVDVQAKIQPLAPASKRQFKTS